VSCHISVRDISFLPFEEFVFITVTTDVPCHLWCRLTLEQPWVHKKTSFRRGLGWKEDVRFCFTVYEDNEQIEAGDTLVHTWAKPDWPPCTTKWLYFWGSIAGEVCVSDTPFFVYHRPLPPEIEEMKVLAEYASRSLISSHGTWSNVWGGSGVKILLDRQAPAYKLHTEVSSVVAYDIRRACLFFYLPILPTGSTLLEAKLSIYCLSHTLVGQNLCLTEGAYSEPIRPEDWPDQNPYNTILGKKLFATFVDNQFNDIALDTTGLNWLHYAIVRSHQRESYDHDPNVYMIFYTGIWLCQTFTPDRYHRLTAINVRLKKYAGTPRTVYAKIYATNPAGEPTGPPLAEGETDGSTLSTAIWGDWRAILLGDGFSATKGTKYALVLSSPLSTASHYPAAMTTSIGGYPAGEFLFSTDAGINWNDAYIAHDMHFVEYNHLLKGARQIALRTTSDVGNTAPPPGHYSNIQFYTPQKGDDYAPFLTIKYKPPT